MNADGEDHEAEHEDESATVDDLRRSLALSTDLLDQDVMRRAWE